MIDSRTVARGATLELPGASEGGDGMNIHSAGPGQAFPSRQPGRRLIRANQAPIRPQGLPRFRVDDPGSRPGRARPAPGLAATASGQSSVLTAWQAGRVWRQLRPDRARSSLPHRPGGSGGNSARTELGPSYSQAGRDSRPGERHDAVMRSARRSCSPPGPSLGAVAAGLSTIGPHGGRRRAARVAVAVDPAIAQRRGDRVGRAAMQEPQQRQEAPLAGRTATRLAE